MPYPYQLVLLLDSKRQLKVMDWPPSEGFADRLKRHNQDFLEMLPLPEYMHPALGPLNTYRCLLHTISN